MDIIVCIKQVLDPDIPPRDFKVDEDAKRVVPPPNVPPVVNNFDEYAIEEAIQIKEAHGGKVTVLTVGEPAAMDSLKKALAMGCDEAVLIHDSAFEGSDAFGSARVLAAAVGKLGQFDLILCGRISSDWSTGSTALALAEALGLPSASQLQKVEPLDRSVRCERVVEDGVEVVEVPLPCLVTVSNEINEPRLPSVRGILTASRKKVPIWSAADLELDPEGVGAGAAALELLRLYKPVHESKCLILGGETLEEAAEKLALKLREDKII
ncbi:MAG: electron transfer flavoprotein subunit beta/FixA family protein [Nitrospinota bacterium]